MFLRSLVVFLILPLAVFAQDLPQPLSDTVSDFADLLPPDDEARIAAQIATIRDETGIQIAVATMDRIANYGAIDLSIEAYAKLLFNTWGIGDAARDDGILILVARDDRVTRIALGSGYDAVYDGRAARVIDTAMLPEFRAERFVQGIEAGVDAARDRIITPFLKNEPVTGTSGFDGPERYMFLFPVAIVLGFLALIFRRKIGDQAARFHRCENCSHRGLSRSRDILRAATGVAAGEAILRYHCNNCGHDRTETYAVAPAGKSSGGGGSSGFGGGGSSGGGATGRW